MEKNGEMMMMMPVTEVVGDAHPHPPTSPSYHPRAAQLRQHISFLLALLYYLAIACRLSLCVSPLRHFAACTARFAGIFALLYTPPSSPPFYLLHHCRSPHLTTLSHHHLSAPSSLTTTMPAASCHHPSHHLTHLLFHLPRHTHLSPACSGWWMILVVEFPSWFVSAVSFFCLTFSPFSAPHALRAYTTYHHSSAWQRPHPDKIVNHAGLCHSLSYLLCTACPFLPLTTVPLSVVHGFTAPPHTFLRAIPCTHFPHAHCSSCI